MRDFYRGPDARVTSSEFEWFADIRRTFSIDRLRNSAITRHSIRGSWLPAVGAAALVLVGGYVLLPAWSAWVVLAAFVLTVLAIVVRWQRSRIRWQLVAALPGRQVVIYSTVDATRFNQVARALNRARESRPEAVTAP